MGRFQFKRIAPLRPRTLPLRSVHITEQLDVFLVCAVGTILVIRTQLWLTNYPQLGGSGLHIAHLLWGGLLMMIAVIVMGIYISPAARKLGVVLGGIGFGFFIDELGKFITSDNNYFFRPTAAIIYIIFIVFFLVSRQLRRRRGFTEREYLLNSIELLKESAMHDMDVHEQHRALELLDNADQSDPLVAPLRKLLKEAQTVEHEPTFTTRAADAVRNTYFSIIRKPWFGWVLSGVFGLWALGAIFTVLYVGGTVVFELIDHGATETFKDIDDTQGELTVFTITRLVSAAVAGVLVMIGLTRLRRSRHDAYRMFERAILITLFITQFCAFVESQFGAVIAFLINVFLFVTVRYMIAEELELEREQAAGLIAPETAPPKGTKPTAAPALS